MKSLKILKGKSEDVNQRTDNAGAKRNRTKGQTMIVKTVNRKQTTDKLNPSKNWGCGVRSSAPNKPFLPHQWHPSCICKTTQTSCDMRIVLDTWIPGNLFTSMQRYKIFHADAMAKHATFGNKKKYRKAQDNDDLSHYCGMSIMIH